jgi:hypothetical protein
MSAPQDRATPEDRAEFSVVIFYPDESHQYIERFVKASRAFEVAQRLQTIGVRAPSDVEQVMITDGGDHCVYRWKRDLGRVWPTDDVLDMGRRRSL